MAAILLDAVIGRSKLLGAVAPPPGTPQAGIGQGCLPDAQGPPAAPIHPQRCPQGAQAGVLAQALHQFQIFHQGDGRHTPGDGQQAAGQQQPLVAIGKLAPAAA
jgi:hypothetical protein